MLRRPRPLLLAGLTVLAVSAPLAAQAAPVLSRADAEAVRVAVAGQGQGTGTVEATYDGEERVTGETAPASPVDQDFLDLGVLTQQATAGNGFAAACAGAAGAGGGVVQVGDGSCLTPGDNVDGSLTDLSLEGLGLTAPEAPDGLELPEGLDLAGEVDAAIQEAVGQLDEAVGPLGLSLRFDAIEGRCTVDGGSPRGSASLANAALVVRGGGEEVEVVRLPADPRPDTEVVTDLSEVVDLVLGAVDTQLREGLEEALAPLGEGLAPVREQVVDGVRENLEEQLAPLEQNVLRVVLNEQRTPGPDSLRVTALHAEVLPVAAEELGAAAVDVRIGDVGCGPTGRVADATTPEPQAAPPASQPRLPTAVSAGVAGQDDGGLGLLPWATLAVGAAAAATAGWSSLRRRRA